MTYRLSIRDEAAQQMVETFLWYESRRSGLGEAFFSSLDSVYHTICSHPEAFQKRYKNFRAATLNGFPYIVFYEINDADIVVFSIFHTRRNPDTLRK